MIKILTTGLFFFCVNVGLYDNYYFGNYYRHEQICSFTYLTDRQWQLNIMPDNTFVYTMKYVNTRDSTTNTIKKYYGSCKSINDTLKLHENKLGKVFTFLIKNSRLIPVEQIPGRLENLDMDVDYLEKSYDVIK